MGPPNIGGRYQGTQGTAGETQEEQFGLRPG